MRDKAISQKKRGKDWQKLIRSLHSKWLFIFKKANGKHDPESTIKAY